MTTIGVRPPSRLRRLGFALGALAIAWLVIELAAVGLHVVANGHPYPKTALKREMKRSIRGLTSGTPEPSDGAGLVWRSAEDATRDVIEVIHPYLGFVLDPDRNDRPVNDVGFMAARGRDERLPKRDPGHFVLGVFGGSFAVGVSVAAHQVFAECGVSAGRPIVLHQIALGGYKQPQQVMALAYLTGLGAEYDLVLNVDGFNEVALPGHENVSHGVHPNHPRMWHLRAGTVIGPERARAVGRVEFYRDLRDRWARLHLESKLYRSPALLLVWQIGDASVSRWARADEVVAATGWVTDAASPPPAVRGPRWEGGDASGPELMEELADHWVRSSLQMKALAEANGARYVHALQPNQYVEGSKPFSAEEVARALGGGPFADAVRRGYPALIERGPVLEAAGIEFVDLTGVFAEDTRSLYVDDCCHVNHEGSLRVAQAICDAL